MDARRGLLATIGSIALLLMIAMALRPMGAQARPVTGAPDCPIFPAASPWNQRFNSSAVARSRRWIDSMPRRISPSVRTLRKISLLSTPANQAATCASTRGPFRSSDTMLVSSR